MLIEHRPRHLNECAVLAFHNTVLRWGIRRRELVFEALVTTEAVETRVPEFSAIVTVVCPHWPLTLVPKLQYQVSNKIESLIFKLHEKHPREVRKVVHYDKHIPLPTDRLYPGWTYSVHMEKLSW